MKKYTDLQELDAAVLRAFIDRIEVSHVDKKSRTREITIVYNFIGAFGQRISRLFFGEY